MYLVYVFEFQGLFEGLKVQRTEDGRLLLFRPEENAKRMINGAQRMCMPAPSVHTFVEAVRQTVLANERWVFSSSELPFINYLIYR